MIFAAPAVASQRVEAVVEEVLEDGPDVDRVGAGPHRPLALERHRQAVLAREGADVVGERPDHPVERDSLELGLADAPDRAQEAQLRQGPIRLGPGPGDQVVAPRVVARRARRQLVEQEAEGVQGVIDLVQDRRGQDPDGLVALDLLQPHAQRLGPPGGLLRREELGAKAQVMGAHAEQDADEDREDVVDRRRARAPASRSACRSGSWPRRARRRRRTSGPPWPPA